MEHSLHLAAKHFVESIAPSLNKQHGTLGAGTEDGDDNNDNNDGDDDDVDTVDSLGKAMALVKQVCNSVEIEHVGLTCPTDPQVSSSQNLFSHDLQPSRDRPARASFLGPYSMGIPLQIYRTFHPTQKGAR